MAVKAIVTQIKSGNNGILFYVDYYNSPDITSSDGNFHQVYYSDFASIDISTMKAAMDAEIISYIFGVFGWTITASDITYYDPTFTQPDAVAAATQARSFANPTRTLNSAFQISTTRDALVTYSVDIAATLSLVTGQVGTVVVEYADNSGISTNVVEVGRFVNGNAGSLAIGLNLTQTQTANIGGFVPAGKYVRIRTVNTTGTPTFTFRSSQEVLV